MVRAPDLDAAFEDVLGVVRTARVASMAWRTLCVRERRRLGAKTSDALAALDLDDDVSSIRPIVHRVAHESPAADTLVFGLFDAIDDGSTPCVGYHVAAITTRGREASDFMHDPWMRKQSYLQSKALDAIAELATRAVASAEFERRTLLESAIMFGAAALTSRFASIALPHRLVIAFDEDRFRPLATGVPRFAEIVPARAEEGLPVTFAQAVPRLVHAL